MTRVLILRAWGKVRPINLPGVDVVQIPVVKAVPNIEVIKGVQLSNADYVIVMSSLVVRYMGDELRNGLGSGNARIIGVGPSTCEAIRKLGLTCELPSEYSSHGIVSHMRNLRPGRVVVLRSTRGNDIIRRGLTEFGFEVIEYGVYDVVPDRENATLACLLIDGVDYVVFMSPMTYEAVRECVRDRLGGRVVVAIGSTTATRLTKDGIKALTPTEYTQSGVMGLITQLITNSESPDLTTNS